MLRPIDDPLIEALGLDRPCRIADLACGGGGTTLQLAARAPVGSEVHGYDISPSLIAAARARPGASGVTFTLADIASDLPAAPYDRLASRFGMMFFHDPPAAFRNLCRWLVPGGRFAFAVWGSPADNPWMTTAREVVARFVTLPEVDPALPGPFRYADGADLIRRLSEAGFETITLKDWRGELPVGGGLTATQAASFAFAAFSGFADLLAEAGEPSQTAAQQALTALLGQHEREGAVWMKARVSIVSGTRAGQQR